MYKSCYEKNLIPKTHTEYPIYPSCFITVKNSMYEQVVNELQNKLRVPSIFFDGDIIIVPESYVELINYLITHYCGEVVATDQMKECEFATLTIAANVGDELIAIGHSVVGLAGTTKEMLDKALRTPKKAATEWRQLYLQAAQPQ